MNMCVCVFTALGNHAIAGESASCSPAWTDDPFLQADDAWAAFPRDSLDEGRDVAEQWWPTSAVEERRDRLSSNQNLVIFDWLMILLQI